MNNLILITLLATSFSVKAAGTDPLKLVNALGIGIYTCTITGTNAGAPFTQTLTVFGLEPRDANKICINTIRLATDGTATQVPTLETITVTVTGIEVVATH